MYKFIKIRHDIPIQCLENYMVPKIINYMLEIDIYRNSPQKIECPEGCFLRVWVSKKTARRPAGQCWLRPWPLDLHIAEKGTVRQDLSQ